ncbi:MAG: Hpt domain-containing protein [Pseudomonadota bacterium]
MRDDQDEDGSASSGRQTGEDALREAQIAEAEARVRELAGAFLEEARRAADALQARIDKALDEAAPSASGLVRLLADLAAYAHDIRGQGGSFGHDSIAAAAADLEQIVSSLNAAPAARLAAGAERLNALRAMLARA